MKMPCALFKTVSHDMYVLVNLPMASSSNKLNAMKMKISFAYVKIKKTLKFSSKIITLINILLFLKIKLLPSYISIMSMKNYMLWNTVLCFCFLLDYLTDRYFIILVLYEDARAHCLFVMPI